MADPLDLPEIIDPPTEDRSAFPESQELQIAFLSALVKDLRAEVIELRKTLDGVVQKLTTMGYKL